MIEPGESALLMTIAEAGAAGGEGAAGWPGMLDALARHLQADGAGLRLAASGWDCAGPVARPLPAVLTGLRLNRVYAAEELADRMAHPADPALADATDARAIGLRLGSGEDEAVGWLLLTRRRGAFRGVASASLSALAPHVARAFRSATRLAALESRAVRAEALLGRLGVGALAWDRQDRALALDGVARGLLARLGDGGPGGTLSRPPAGTVLQPLAGGVELLVLAEGSDPPALLRDTTRPLPAPGLLARALGITPAEARLARALAGGDSLRAAAARLGLTEATARLYSRQIYARTGLSGQPDLMRRIRGSALGLGLLPGPGPD